MPPGGDGSRMSISQMGEGRALDVDDEAVAGRGAPARRPVTSHRGQRSRSGPSCPPMRRCPPAGHPIHHQRLDRRAPPLGQQPCQHRLQLVRAGARPRPNHASVKTVTSDCSRVGHVPLHVCHGVAGPAWLAFAGGFSHVTSSSWAVSFIARGPAGRVRGRRENPAGRPMRRAHPSESLPCSSAAGGAMQPVLCYPSGCGAAARVTW